MTRSSFALAVTATLLAVAAPAAARTCLNTDDIRGHDSPNGKTIIFHMRDGSTWRNTLQRDCSGLRFHGFAWAVHSNQVCEDDQALRVLGTGESCVLGKFEKVSGPKG